MKIGEIVDDREKKQTEKGPVSYMNKPAAQINEK